mmetsp:Transcript_37130/g.74949  ORF Transcript_37130/g.74949 Transcript_37130/m.74949 type:complete len:187 (-) Transcript_37130:210-770(-)
MPAGSASSSRPLTPRAGRREAADANAQVPSANVDKGNVRALRAAAAASLQQSLQRDRGHQDSPPDSSRPSMKAIWEMRNRQAEEMGFANAITAESPVRGPEARQTTSYLHLKQRRTKHVRSLMSPREHFNQPVSIAMDIGWHVGDEDSGTPRAGCARSVFPRSTCPMTRHVENMYSTSAQHIIRRW